MEAGEAVGSRSLRRQLLTDTISVGALTSLAKIAGAVKVIVMARYFGAGDNLDAFLIAFLLPSFVAEVIAGGWSPAIVLVFLHTAAREGEAGLARLARTALAFSCGVTSLIAVGLAIAGPYALPLLGSSFSAAKLKLATALFFALILWMPISACITTWRALLNSRGVFALPAIAPTATPVLTIAVLWAFAAKAGVYALCVGTVGGALAEAVILAAAVRSQGLPVAPAWHGWTPQIAAIWKQYLPLTAGSAISSSGVIIDQAVAGMLGAGSVSALAYGNKLVSVGLAIASTACGTVVLPVFSRLAASGRWRQLRRSAFGYIGAAALAGAASAMVLAWYSQPVVRVMFEHGAFGARETQTVAVIQACALVQVPFALALAILIRLTVAVQASSILTGAAVIAVVVNIVADLALARWLGVAGIALATALVQAVALVTLISLLFKQERRLA